MGTGAFAVDALVLLLAQFRPGQTMRSGEVGPNGQKGVHGMSEVVGPEARLFVEAQRRDRQVGAETLPDHPHQRLGGGKTAGGG